MALKDWVSPGMTSVRPCQGQFYQHSSGANVFYDDFGYCTPQYEGIPASTAVTVTSTFDWTTLLLYGALAFGAYYFWTHRKTLLG
jgi:hypothetical protein